MVNVKRVVLELLFREKCLYLTSPIFNSLAKSNRTFYLPGRKYYTMIVVNPRNHRVKNAIFRVPFGIFSTLVSVTFFWYCLVEIQLLKKVSRSWSS